VRRLPCAVGALQRREPVVLLAESVVFQLRVTAGKPPIDSNPRRIKPGSRTEFIPPGGVSRSGTIVQYKLRRFCNEKLTGARVTEREPTCQTRSNDDSFTVELLCWRVMWHATRGQMPRGMGREVAACREQQAARRTPKLRTRKSSGFDTGVSCRGFIDSSEIHPSTLTTKPHQKRIIRVHIYCKTF